MKPHEPCYGKLFPDPGTIADDHEVCGKVFGYRVRQTGVIPIGLSMITDLAAWEECTSCADFATCYSLSAGKLLMGMATRN
jgi:hypothetical protein